MFLLDTDVISRVSPFSRLSADVAPWITVHEAVSFLSVVTLSELSSGAARLGLKGAGRKRTILADWIAEVDATMRGRWLAVDMDVARRTGELMARALASGHAPGYPDACIAATADLHGLTVVTFNDRHFAAFGVPHREPLLDTT